MTIMTMANAATQGPMVPAGYALVYFQVNTVDRLNKDTASFDVTATGFSQNYAADAGGRVSALIPTTQTTYNVHLNHNGQYYNDGDQTLVVESKGIYWVYFDLFDYPNVSTVVRVQVRSGNVVTATNGDQTFSQTAGSDGIAEFHGLTVEEWTFTCGSYSKTQMIDELLTEIALIPWRWGVTISRSTSSPTSRCTYTGDAVGITPASGHNLNGWAGSKLIEGIAPCKIVDNTKTYLNKTDLTQTISGEASNIATVGNDAFTEFPLRYLYLHSDSSNIYIEFSDSKIDANFEALAHTYQNEVQSAFYWACFLGYVSSNRVYSRSGVTPTVSTSITNFIAYAQARGTGYDIIKWHQLVYIQALFVLLYCSTDSQTALGRGLVSSGSAAQTVGPTSFDNEYGMAGSTSSAEHMAFFWLTDLWGNVYQWVGCAKTNASRQLMTIVGGNSSVDEADFTNRGTTSLSSNISGYISDVDGGPYSGFFPKTCSGSSTTYWCDYGGVTASYFPYFGGYWNGADYAGVFVVYFYYSATSTNTYIGSRLSLSVGVS